jgi:hypothetical protein
MNKQAVDDVAMIARRAIDKLIKQKQQMQYAISVLQSGIVALETAGIRDHRVEQLREAIKVLEK